MDIGFMLLVVLVTLGALGAIVAWALGFRRAMQEQTLLDRLRPYARPIREGSRTLWGKQDLVDRLHAYCQRGG